MTAPTLPAEAAQARLVDDPDGLADRELIAALDAAGRLDALLAGLPEPLALLRIDDQPAVEEHRAATLQAAELVRVLREHHRLLERQEEEAAAQAAPTSERGRRNLTPAQTISEERRLLDVAIAEAEADLDAAVAELRVARGQATSPIGELPMVVLERYFAAADRDADCSVDWALLAGIGWIESRHGTLNGSSIGAGALVQPPVFGPLLDGGGTVETAAERAERLEAEAEAAALAAELAEQAEARRRIEALHGIFDEPEAKADTAAPSPGETAAPSPADTDTSSDSDNTDTDSDEGESEGNGFAVIADTDGGRLDGNADWDRAVGPMQFLPGTWRLFGVDADGNGVADPQDLDDAAAAAADYLCHLEQRNGPDPSRFILGYNDSTSYVEAVLAEAERLRDAGRLPALVDRSESAIAPR